VWRSHPSPINRRAKLIPGLAISGTRSDWRSIRERVQLRHSEINFMSSAFQVRFASIADVDLITLHRAQMFRDMGELPPELFESFRAQSRESLERLFERGDYIGWLAYWEKAPARIIAGAGVLVREVPPHPQPDSRGQIDIVSGRQAVIVNVYTEPAWRRRGLAALVREG